MPNGHRKHAQIPQLADRLSPDDWLDAGAKTIWQRAGERAREVLASHYPVRIDAEADAAIRRDFPIRLEPHWQGRQAP